MESLLDSLLVVALLSALGFFAWEQYDYPRRAQTATRHANECLVFKQDLGVAWARALKGSA